MLLVAGLMQFSLHREKTPDTLFPGLSNINHAKNNRFPVLICMALTLALLHM